MIAFWWIVLDLPEISKSSNKIWNGKSVEIALRNDSEFLRCGPLCAQYLWAAFDISSALPGQYLSFCRNELIVLMEYATSEIGQRWSPSWLQKVWDLKKRLFKDIQSKIGLKTVGLVFNPLEVRDLLEVCPILSHIDWLLKKTIFCCCLASCHFTMKLLWFDEGCCLRWISALDSNDRWLVKDDCWFYRSPTGVPLLAAIVAPCLSCQCCRQEAWV